jgi:hypothetical protein
VLILITFAVMLVRGEGPDDGETDVDPTRRRPGVLS